MADGSCPNCGAPMDRGFLSTTNGSGLFWAHESSASRLRPVGLEVVVPTGFMGTYSANIPGLRCPKCGTLVMTPPKAPGT